MVDLMLYRTSFFEAVASVRKRVDAVASFGWLALHSAAFREPKEAV
jgi:hypothetical protein